MSDKVRTGLYDKLLADGLIRQEDIAPDVSPFQFYIEAYSELSTCRQSNGFGTGPIPFTAVVDYARIYEVEDLEEFLYIIRRMEQASEEEERRQRGAESKNSKNRSNGARGSRG